MSENSKHGNNSVVSQSSLMEASTSLSPKQATVDVVYKKACCDVAEKSVLNADCNQDVRKEQCDDAANEKKQFAKRTVIEFAKSLLIGIFPVATDYVISILIVYFFFARGADIGIKALLFENIERPQNITTIATVFGYGISAVVAYLFSVLFVFDNKKKGRTPKGIIIFIAVEGFAYGFNILLGWCFNLFLSSTVAFVFRICTSYVVVFLLRKFLIFMPDKKQAIVVKETDTQDILVADQLSNTPIAEQNSKITDEQNCRTTDNEANPDKDER